MSILPPNPSSGKSKTFQEYETALQTWHHKTLFWSSFTVFLSRLVGVRCTIFSSSCNTNASNILHHVHRTKSSFFACIPHTRHWPSSKKLHNLFLVVKNAQWVQIAPPGCCRNILLWMVLPAKAQHWIKYLSVKMFQIELRVKSQIMNHRLVVPGTISQLGSWKAQENIQFMFGQHCTMHCPT